MGVLLLVRAAEGAGSGMRGGPSGGRRPAIEREGSKISPGRVEGTAMQSWPSWGYCNERNVSRYLNGNNVKKRGEKAAQFDKYITTDYECVQM